MADGRLSGDHNELTLVSTYVRFDGIYFSDAHGAPVGDRIEVADGILPRNDDGSTLGSTYGRVDCM